MPSTTAASAQRSHSSHSLTKSASSTKVHKASPPSDKLTAPTVADACDISYMEMRSAQKMCNEILDVLAFATWMVCATPEQTTLYRKRRLLPTEDVPMNVVVWAAASFSAFPEATKLVDTIARIFANSPPSHKWLCHVKSKLEPIAVEFEALLNDNGKKSWNSSTMTTSIDVVRKKWRSSPQC